MFFEYNQKGQQVCLTLVHILITFGSEHLKEGIQLCDFNLH